MPEPDNTPFSGDNFSGTVRLFPLPNLVLFPHIIQPLHLFEPRYCELLEDAMSSDRLIAMAVLEPGWEDDYEGRPSIYPVACLGRVVVSHQLEDASYNVIFEGLCRVRLIRELPPDRSFREAEVEICNDVHPPGPEADCLTLYRKFRDTLARLLAGNPLVREELDCILHSDVPLSVLTDVIGYTLDLSISEKKQLLAETCIHRRANVLLSHISQAFSTPSSTCTSCIAFPPAFSQN